MSKWQEVSSELDINYDSDTEVSVIIHCFNELETVVSVIFS